MHDQMGIVSGETEIIQNKINHWNKKNPIISEMINFLDRLKPGIILKPPI